MLSNNKKLAANYQREQINYNINKLFYLMPTSGVAVRRDEKSGHLVSILQNQKYKLFVSVLVQQVFSHILYKKSRFPVQCKAVQ